MPYIDPEKQRENVKIASRKFRERRKEKLSLIQDFYEKRMDAQIDLINKIVQPDFTSEVSGDFVKEFKRNQKVILFLDSKIKALQFAIDISRKVRRLDDLDLVINTYENALGAFEKFLKELQDASDKLKEL